MPKTGITPKRLTSLTGPTSTGEDRDRSAEGSLASGARGKCLGRRFQMYSQLPVRCQTSGPYYRPPQRFGGSFKLSDFTAIDRTPPNGAAKSCPATSRCVSIFRAIGTPPCKKSLSMIDLSPLSVDQRNNDGRSDTNSSVERSEEVGDRSETLGNVGGNGNGFRGRIWMDGFAPSESEYFSNPKKAASVVCRLLILNAWRRKRAEILHLHDTIDGLGQQVEHLHLQIVVLRRLLDTENARVGRLNSEVHRTKLQLEDALRERDSLRSEKTRLEDEAKRLTDLSDDRLVTAENLRNELLTAQDQIRVLDQQISKDHQKLLKLREDKRILLDKVSASEAIAAERGSRAEKAESTAEDLQLKLATQIALLESSQDRYNKELKAKEVEKSTLEVRLKSAEETGRSLNLRTVFLESQLADREAALRRIETAYNSQLLELNELRERLVRQSQESGWSTRMLQIAGSVVRAPRAILRSLSLLSSAGPMSFTILPKSKADVKDSEMDS